MKAFVYIGNWDRHKAGPNGFGICRFNPETGGLELLKSVFPEITVGATWLDRRRNILYCTDEYTTLPGNYLGGGGHVHAFKVDTVTGDLTEINRQPSYGVLPSGVTMDGSGQYLVATHHTDRVPITKVHEDGAGGYRIALEYDDATTVLFPLGENGAIGAPCHVYKHSGSGGPLPRQTHPQLHSVTLSPSGRHLVVCDKGNDEIVVFEIEGRPGKLRVCQTVKSVPGSSPRYSAFHPTRPWLFVNHETRAIVTSFHCNASGRLHPISTVSALPAEYEDDPGMHQADLRIHPSGLYLYSLLRGINAVSVFRILEETGELELIQTATIDGLGPRGCAFSPDGRFLVIAALPSHEVVVWAVGRDGLLSPTGKKVNQPNPGNVTFVAIT